MLDEIFACLDGSAVAEQILPLARALANTKPARLVLLRVVADTGELAPEETYLRDLAGQFCAEMRFLLSSEPATAIITELDKHPHAIAAMTTHARGTLTGALLGSVASQVLRGAKRPVLLLPPLPDNLKPPEKISMVIVALDGSDFSERIIPFAVDIAKPLKARLCLVQSMLPEAALGAVKNDILESSYLHAKADQIKKQYAMDADWDALHGQAGYAICSYIHGMQNTLLAMTSHTRHTLQQAIVGSVAGYCIRHAEVPILLYSPKDESKN